MPDTSYRIKANDLRGKAFTWSGMSWTVLDVRDHRCLITRPQEVLDSDPTKWQWISRITIEALILDDIADQRKATA